jgi:signal transduction histidine kinase
MWFPPGRQKTAWLVVLGGWTVFGVCSLGFSVAVAAAMEQSSRPLWQVLIDTLGTAWIWAVLTPPALWLTRRAGFRTGRRLRGAAIHAVGASGFVLLSAVLQWPLAALAGGQPRFPLDPRVFQASLLGYLVIVAAGLTARCMQLDRSRQIHASELEARLAKTHLQVLRMQLQPHFLFNTLNTVAELVHTDPDTADQMITRLGRLLRLSLDHAGHQVVPLRQEIDFLRLYVEIEQIRFHERLQIVWDLAPDTLDAAVPTLLWHPVLENAIRHGVTPLAGGGRIVIASHRKADDLVLEVRDNGMGLPPGGVAREGVGLRNIRERLEQLYGPRARFRLEPAFGGGTVATLRIPFTHCDAAHTPVPLTRTDLEELVG